MSALAPAGRDAERVLDLFVWMTAGAALIWLLVVGLAFYAIHVEPGPHPEWKARALIVGGGAVMPIVVLTVLLAFGLSTLPKLLAPAPPGAPQIVVSGEQWWWRVTYPREDGTAVELANELRLPVGRRVEVQLASPDVIHSFWVPSLAGKMDMIPGRATRLALEPTRTGIFRGACAEYCGASHAFMHFYVVVMEEDAFERWLDLQSAPAQAPADHPGLQVFLASGCGACHTIRGTPADGVIGPDLTHVGSRVSLGAGRLANREEDFLRWISRTTHLKPEVRMPAFGMLPADDVRTIAAYLDALR